MGDSMKPGGGGRFKKFMSKVESEGKSADSARAIAAAAGREKYGDKKMNSMSEKGKKRSK